MVSYPSISGHHDVHQELYRRPEFFPAARCRPAVLGMDNLDVVVLARWSARRCFEHHHRRPALFGPRRYQYSGLLPASAAALTEILLAGAAGRRFHPGAVRGPVRTQRPAAANWLVQPVIIVFAEDDDGRCERCNPRLNIGNHCRGLAGKCKIDEDAVRHTDPKRISGLHPACEPDDGQVDQPQ